MMYYIIALLVIGYILITWFVRSRRIKDYSDRFVFITGCDSGFGNGLARRLDRLGFHTFAACLTEKGADDLTKATSTRLVAVCCDVTDDDVIKQTVATVKEHLPNGKGIWALVNNAGVTGAVAPTEWLSREDWKIPMSVNILGMASITNHFLPLLRISGGRIINTSSVLGRVAAGPTPYVVSKYCVEGYSDLLRRELWHQGVSVHIIEPGAFKTNITNPGVLAPSMEKAYRKLDPEVQQYYGKEYCSGLETLMGLLSWEADGNLDKVVDAYTHAITAVYPKTRYVVGVDANILFRLLWHVPDIITDLLLGLTYPRPQGQR
ncbi:dehydrogenase/reductase SDR family member 9-like isoform X2 [Haliotis asinina]|uniref:dehydrogenase/reductase SDR family member 9-like isoform X2 n=1 Tax=Haliotis asinina TaxID=109174 RepID=UPI003531A31F